MGLGLELSIWGTDFKLQQGMNPSLSPSPDGQSDCFQLLPSHLCYQEHNAHADLHTRMHTREFSREYTQGWDFWVAGVTGAGFLRCLNGNRARSLQECSGKRQRGMKLVHKGTDTQKGKVRGLPEGSRDRAVWGAGRGKSDDSCKCGFLAPAQGLHASPCITCLSMVNLHPWA